MAEVKPKGRPSMKSALQSSLKSEKQSIDERFERAEHIITLTETREHSRLSTPNQSSRPKIIRRTFSLTEDEYNLLQELKRRCNYQGFEVPQSKLVRAGLHLLAELSDKRLQKVLDGIENLNPGRTKS